MDVEINHLTELAYEGSSVHLALAEQVVNGVHTSPSSVQGVFKRADARMSVMWHLAFDHETVGPAFSEMRSKSDGPATIAPDLTPFTITKDAIVT